MSSGTDTATDTIRLTIDGREVGVPAGSTVWEAARTAGVEIPVLCHDPRLRPVGVCRVCLVDVGEKKLAASCIREAADGMTVTTRNEKIDACRKGLTELLLSDYPADAASGSGTRPDELVALAAEYGIEWPPSAPDAMAADNGDRTAPVAGIPSGNGRPIDSSSPVIRVDHQSCILCDRCIRACDEVQVNAVIGRTGKGYGTRIGFDLDDPMGVSTCVACGECEKVCPTGALTLVQLFDGPDAAVGAVDDGAEAVNPRSELEQIDSVCPYCGVGCAITYWVDEERNRVAYADGRASPVNHERLCVKGRYGFDYAHHPQRLTVPLIRKDSAYPKGPLSPEVEESDQKKHRRPGGLVDYEHVLPHFREATWEEALELAGRRLREIKEEHGSPAMAGFGSAKCSNEEAYLFQKLIRAGFGTNNIDHCTRLCHASSVAALLEGIGSGAVTNVFGDVANAEVALITGSNTTANHPVAATFMKQAAREGKTKIIVVEPRRIDMADHAEVFAQIRSGTDVAFYNAVMHVLVEEDLVNHEFIRTRTKDYESLVATVEKYDPEMAAAICGIPAGEIRRVARLIGRASSVMVFWGMGIAQSVHGTDNARCLIALMMMTGNIGKPGTGLHPLRGQNNVQGASDAGLIPIVYPDYQKVGDPEVRAKFETAWGVALDPEPGLTVVEIMGGALEGRIRGMYMMGENPFLSDPNVNKVRKALANLDFLVVQDIFLTETAEFADVILPATTHLEKDGTYTNTDRRVQVGRKALDAPGSAREDWRIVCELSTALGYPMSYGSPADVFDEMTSLAPSYAGLTHENLGLTGKLWPCPDLESDGTQVLFGDSFPTPDGLGRFVPAEFTPAAEPPDGEYPFVLNTGRLLEHWHTGTMTRRSRALHAIAPAARVDIHPDDLASIGAEDGDRLSVASRRGSITLTARASRELLPGTVFIPFHFREAAANVLTYDALDPYGKIPGFKFCAVRVTPAR